MSMVDFDEKKFLEGLQEWAQLAELSTLVEEFKNAPPEEKVRKFSKIIQEVLEHLDIALGDISVVARDEKVFNALVGFIDDLIKLPFYLEWFDGPGIKMILRPVVDMAAKYSQGE